MDQVITKQQEITDVYQAVDVPLDEQTEYATVYCETIHSMYHKCSNVNNLVKK